MNINKLLLISECLVDERKSLLSSIDKITISRNESPLPTDTRSDTSRIQADKMLSELKDKLSVLESLINNLPKEIPDDTKGNELWSYLETKINGKAIKIIIVPKGYGGREIKGIKLVSVNAPCVKSLIAN